MGIAEAGKHFLEERHKLAQTELNQIKRDGQNMLPEEREEIMFWKGVNAALDLAKILDGKEAA